MPTGGVVIDAFKNLIRHGKQNHDTKDDSSRNMSPQRQQQQQPQQQQQQQTSSNQNSVRSKASSSREREKEKEREKDHHKEAQAMLQQEKDQKSKMPTYKGLEKFKLLDKMGDGAFSNVYKAVDISTGQKVAIKVVRKYELNASQNGDKHLNPQFKKRLRVTERANILKEVQIMRGINHPSIVKLISFSESEEFYFLVLELLEGGELFHQIVKLTYFSENLARHVILQVANGIRYLHEERGVVHRDIKPENLLFQRIPIVPSKHPVHRQYDEDKEDEGEFIPGVGGGGIGRVKIADFGLSKIIWNEETMTPCGTVGYTAPEIVKDERYSKSVDMWAMGCVLYTLLCGFPPFYDESINILTEKVARGYYTFLSPWWDDISDSAKDLITHLLCVDPAQRYTIDEFLAHPWCHAAPAPPPPPTPSVSRSLDSPLLHAARGGRDGRSPGLASLKEAFDITYAVHRMEEEGARRRAYNGPGGAGTRGFLHELNEDDEEMDIDGEVVEAARQREAANIPVGQMPIAKTVVRNSKPRDRNHNRNLVGSTNTSHLAEGRAGQRDRANPARRFELDLDNATLLGRRNNRGNIPMSAGSSPLSKSSDMPPPYESPGSPMVVG